MSGPHVFANNFWGKDDVGYQRLIQRMHNAKYTCEELQAFYKERAAIEHDYARKLKALSMKGLGSRESGTLARSLDIIRQTTEQMGTSHDTIATQIEQEFLAPFASFSGNIRDRRKTSEDVMVKLTKARKSQDEAAERAKEKYLKECNKISGYKAQQNLLTGKELEKNNKKLDASSFEVTKLERDYQSSINFLSTSSDNWNASWKTTCDKFQELEEERILFTKTNLWEFANALSTGCVNDDEGFEAIRVGLEQCEPSADIEAFTQSEGTGREIMDPPQFTNYLRGFTRDSNTGGYTLAKFGEEDEEDNEHERSFNISHNSLEQSQQSFDNAPDWQPRSQAISAKTHMIEDDGYSSSSPYQGTMSPSSSVYSNATTISRSPVQKANTRNFDFEAEEVYTPSPVEQKRRSWAKPFKRKSSPDLGKVRDALGQSQSSTASGRFDDFEADSQPHVRFEEAEPAFEQHSKRNVPSKAQVDPMLAAIDKLKTPPLGTIPKKKLARPASMPGIASLHDGHYDVRQAPPGRKPVGATQAQPLHKKAASQAPYPEEFAPQVIPARAAARNRRQSFGPGTQSPDQRVVNRRSAEIYAQSPQRSPVQSQSPQRSPVQSQSPQRSPVQALSPRRSAVQAQTQQHHIQQPRFTQQPQQQPQQRVQQASRPRPKSMVETNDISLLPSRTSEGRRVIKHAKALFDFRSRIPMEVGFRKGDILLVTHCQDDGWWEAEVLTTKQIGVAPGNFLQELR